MLAPHRIGIAHKPSHTLRSQVMRPKDPLPIQDKSDVVYRIPCGECPAHYVGETSKCVASRIKEHKLAIKRGEPHSQLWVHMMGTGHSFNFGDVEVVASDNTKGGRLIKEAWLTNQASINRCVDLCQAHVALRAWEERRHQQRRARYCTDVTQHTVTHTPPPQDDLSPGCKLDDHEQPRPTKSNPRSDRRAMNALAIEDNNWHPPENLPGTLDPLNTNNGVAIGYGQNSTTPICGRMNRSLPPPPFLLIDSRNDSDCQDSILSQSSKTGTMGLDQGMDLTSPGRGVVRSRHPLKASPYNSINNRTESSRRGEEGRGVRVCTQPRHPPEAPSYYRNNIQAELLRRGEERGGVRTRAWTSRARECDQRQTDPTIPAQLGKGREYDVKRPPTPRLAKEVEDPSIPPSLSLPTQLQPALDIRSFLDGKQTDWDADSPHPLRRGKERRGANTRAWAICTGEHDRRQTDPMILAQIGKGCKHDLKHPPILPCLFNDGKDSPTSSHLSPPPMQFHLTLDPRSHLGEERIGGDVGSPYQTKNSLRADEFLSFPPYCTDRRSVESGTGVKTRSQTRRLNAERINSAADKRGVGSSKGKGLTGKRGSDTEPGLARGQLYDTLHPSNPNCNNPVPSSPCTHSQHHDVSKAKLDQGVDHSHIRFVRQCEVMDSDSALCARISKDVNCSGVGEFNEDHISPINGIEMPVGRSRPMTRAFLRAQCELRYKTSVSQRPLRP